MYVADDAVSPHEPLSSLRGIVCGFQFKVQGLELGVEG